MDEEKLKQLLDKYEAWNTHCRPITLKIKDWKQGKEYDLVYADSETFWEVHGEHYHFGAGLYLIYKPQLLVDKVSRVDYNDGPAHPGKTYKDLSLEELSKMVVVRYHFDFHELRNMGNEKRAFRWVSTTRQGENKPEFIIEQVEDKV